MTQKKDDMQLAWKSSQLNGGNASYLESIYESYLDDPSSVSDEWNSYFKSLTDSSASRDVNHSAIRQSFIDLAKQEGGATLANVAAGGDKHAAVMDLIYAYRFIGHRIAKMDPLNQEKVETPEDLKLSYHDLSSSDLNTEFNIKEDIYGGPRTLKSIIAEMEAIYCGSIGTEYMHITNIKEKLWIRSKVEKALLQDKISADKKAWLLQRLAAADGLEKYLGMRFAGQKRFSLEGGDSLIPLLDEIVSRSAEGGVEEVVMGMAHRGRLNVLVNTMGKSPENLFKEFNGEHPEELLAGDVKYHMGFSSHVKTPNGDNVHLVLSFNPSHLEIASPVVTGSVRARQARRGFARNKVLPIQMHGDAAFAGQGVVMETLSMSQTRGYTVGGSVHIVINNQVGFTTSNPKDMRSSTYCTGVAKMIEAPIFHVNADDPEAVIRVAQIAVDYHREFNKDVVIDLVCYRRNGHQEVDEPTGTQPLMYQIIKKHPVTYKIYADKLISEGVLDAPQAKQVATNYRTALEAGESVINIAESKLGPKFTIDWAPFMGVPWDIAYSNKIPKAKLKELAKCLSFVPEGFALQKQVAKALADRNLMTEEKKPVNWGYAELLAYAGLLDEGTFIRLSGEDSGRGTFSHRHVALHSQTDGSVYTSFNI
jgi:2-oxoglutarate dehydrogenase E1 component